MRPIVTQAEQYPARTAEVRSKLGRVAADQRGTFGDLGEGDEISFSSQGGHSSIGGDFRHRVHKIEEGKSGKTRNITYETLSTPSDEDWPPGSKRTTRHKHETPLPPTWTVHRKEKDL